MVGRVAVRPALSSDRARWRDFLDERGMRSVARLDELHDASADEALIAEDERGAVVGVLTYAIDDMDCEVSTLYVASPWSGIGTKLIEAAAGEARTAGCRRLWLVTTNDNVDGLRFYQRRGFRLAELHAGAVDRSRVKLKPSIPEIGDHGIPLRDEIVLEMRLAPISPTSGTTHVPTVDGSTH